MTTESTRIPANNNQDAIFVDGWDDGGVWINLQVRGGSAYTNLTADEARQLIAALQEALK